MPTYQYECEECGHGFDAMQSIVEPKLKECPECKEETLNRLIGKGSGIIFKGSGFYETDYKKKVPQAAPCAGGDSSKCAACPASKAAADKA